MNKIKNWFQVRRALKNVNWSSEHSIKAKCFNSKLNKK